MLVLSDCAAHGDADTLESGGAHLRVECITSDDTRDNVYVASMSLAAGREVDEPSTLTVVVGGGQEPREVELEARLDGRVLERGVISLRQGSGSWEVALDPQTLRRGRVLEARIDAPNALALDDTRELSLDEVAELSVLLVDGDPAPNQLDDELRFLALALGLDDGSHGVPRITRIDPDGLAAMELSTYDVVVLANVGTPSEAEADQLLAHVARGGALLITAGENLDAFGYRGRLSKLLPAIPRSSAPVEPALGVARSESMAPSDLLPSGGKGLETARTTKRLLLEALPARQHLVARPTESRSGRGPARPRSGGHARDPSDDDGRLALTPASADRPRAGPRSRGVTRHARPDRPAWCCRARALGRAAPISHARRPRVDLRSTSDRAHRERRCPAFIAHGGARVSAGERELTQPPSRVPDTARDIARRPEDEREVSEAGAGTARRGSVLADLGRSYRRGVVRVRLASCAGRASSACVDRAHDPLDAGQIAHGAHRREPRSLEQRAHRVGLLDAHLDEQPPARREVSRRLARDAAVEAERVVAGVEREPRLEVAHLRHQLRQLALTDVRRIDGDAGKALARRDHLEQIAAPRIDSPAHFEPAALSQRRRRSERGLTPPPAVGALAASVTPTRRSRCTGRAPHPGRAIHEKRLASYQGLGVGRGISTSRVIRKWPIEFALAEDVPRARARVVVPQRAYLRQFRVDQTGSSGRGTARCAHGERVGATRRSASSRALSMPRG